MVLGLIKGNPFRASFEKNIPLYSKRIFANVDLVWNPLLSSKKIDTSWLCSVIQYKRLRNNYLIYF